MLFNVILLCNKLLNTFVITCVMKTMMHFEMMHNDAEEIGKSVSTENKVFNQFHWYLVCLTEKLHFFS